MKNFKPDLSKNNEKIHSVNVRLSLKIICRKKLKILQAEPSWIFGNSFYTWLIFKKIKYIRDIFIDPLVFTKNKYCLRKKKYFSMLFQFFKLLFFVMKVSIKIRVFLNP